MELSGAVALVTGGNGGLGQRICHKLAKEGAHVAVMYAQSRDQAEGVARGKLDLPRGSEARGVGHCGKLRWPACLVNCRSLVYLRPPLPNKAAGTYRALP